MEAELDQLERQARAELEEAASPAQVEAIRVRYLGRRGVLTSALRRLGTLPLEERPRLGRRLNAVKTAVESEIARRRAEAEAAEQRQRLLSERVDVTLPGARRPLGRSHLLTRVLDEVLGIFTAMGFTIAEGPEVEDDYHNFEALNMPPDHPARDMQDTFFVGDGLVLRTHTSPVQIRVMERMRPPLRVVAPGAVYRHDDDVTHSPMFFQVEGFMVDRHIAFADLKGVLVNFCRALFGDQVRVRFRPAFFPFTEPSAEVDIGCTLCGGRGQGGCRVCGGTGWLEILGAGMIHPAVLEVVRYDPAVLSGFAFGMGVDRIAMLKHGIDSIRLLYESDIRFLRQL